MKKSYSFIQIIFFVISILVLGFGFFFDNTFKKGLLIGILTVIALILFDFYTPEIARLPADHEKVKMMRKLNRFSLSFITFCFLYIGWKSEISGTAQDGVIATAITILVMAVIGTAAPKIPFNRYIGLRLPWTVRDEDTWNIAHKILGYLTYPFILLILIGGFLGDLETYIKISLIGWIAIPSIYSALFYYCKFRQS